MLGFFKATEAIEFGKKLADDIARVVPLEETRAKPKNEAKQQDKFRRAILRASELRTRTPLNVYTKARCANALRWSLVDKGYAKPFVEEVVRLVLTRL